MDMQWGTSPLLTEVCVLSGVPQVFIFEFPFSSSLPTYNCIGDSDPTTGFPYEKACFNVILLEYQMINHGGTTYGQFSQMSIIPEKNIGVFTAISGGDALGLPHQIQRLIYM